MRVHLSARQVLWKNRIRALCMHGVMGLLGVNSPLMINWKCEAWDLWTEMCKTRVHIDQSMKMLWPEAPEDTTPCTFPGRSGSGVTESALVVALLNISAADNRNQLISEILDARSFLTGLSWWAPASRARVRGSGKSGPVVKYMTMGFSYETWPISFLPSFPVSTKGCLCRPRL